MKIYNQKKHEILLGDIEKIILRNKRIVVDFSELAKSSSLDHHQEWAPVNELNYCSAEISLYRVRMATAQQIILSAPKLDDSAIVLFSKNTKISAS